jgi:amino acid adenylation domain-containing protein
VARTTFPLAVNANPGGFTLDADTAFLDPATAEAIADALQEQVLRMLADPTAPVARPSVSGRARDLALGEWAVGPVAPTAPRSLHQRVAEQAALRPTAVAVAHRDRTVDYGTLDREARELAGRLRELGVGRETVVGVCADRGPAMVRAVLGVLHAGAAFLPLDPRYPADRLAFMAADSGMRVLVTESGLLGTAPFAGPTVLLDEPITAEPVSVEPGQDDLAYLIYTSGSTGRPKAVGVPHRGLANLIEAQRDELAPTPDDVVLQFASCSFDACVFELTWALANGAALRTAPAEDLRLGPDLAATLRRATAAVLPPTALAVLAEESFPALRTLMSAGEACPADLVRAFAPGRRFVNGYGLTETSVWSNVARPAADDDRPPIGRAVRNTRVYVLDRDLNPVPVGVPGEICVAGPLLARGYLGRPALTAAAFVPDPYGRAGDRLFRTGDLGRHRADGTLEHLGRIDTQVKLRGQRIELGEIETALREQPGVRDAVVLLRTDLPGEPALVGYVIAAVTDAEPLRRALRARMPAHLVPARFVFLDAFPLTSNEKVDRRALPLPTGAGAGYVAPSTPAEVVLAEVWRTVLGRPEIGVHDDFFELGGSSLSTVRVAALAAARGLPVSVRDLVERPTVAALAAVTTARPGGAGEVRSTVRLRDGVGNALWCVHPTGGSATWYVPLARALPAGHPVHAFQARGLLGGVDPTTVTGIAAQYVAELTAAETGPHRLLGWSMGANLALEMADQLHRAGREVAPLVLIEPYLPHPAARDRLAGFVAALRQALALRDAARAEPAGSDGRQKIAAELRDVLLAAGMADSEADLVEDAPVEVWHSLLAALADYTPRTYPGHIHLVVGSESAELPAGTPMPGLDIDHAGYLARWQELAGGGLTVHVTPGNHRSILTEPLVREFATVLEAATP